MSRSKDQKPVEREEYQAIKKSLSKDESLNAAAKRTGRSRGTVKKIKDSRGWAHFQSMNKAAKPAAATAPKTIVPVVKSSKTKVVVKTPSETSPLLDTLNKPERISNKRAAEILGLRMELEVAKKERDDYRAEAASLRKQLSAQQAENIRLSVAFNRKQRSPLNRVKSALLRRKAEV